jgi:8-oxo-dGTP pyrophosphatase MutT (NUDIX family)
MPCALVVVEDADGRVLLHRRTDTGAWSIPAGGAEEGSTFATTAAAELLEETGLAAEPADLIPVGCLSDPEVHVVHYPNGDVTHYFGVVFAAHRWRRVGEPNAAEASETAFFAIDDLPEPLESWGRAALELHERYRATGIFQAG